MQQWLLSEHTDKTGNQCLARIQIEEIEFENWEDFDFKYLRLSMERKLMIDW